MRVLFDQGTPVPIRRALAGHTVRTAWQQKWDELNNGELLGAAEDAGFEVLVATDQRMMQQQSLLGRKIAVVVLSKANWRLIKPAVLQIVAAILAVQPGSFTIVSIPGR